MMSEIFTCGDHGALVSYLYDECTPAERRAIAAHLVMCGACGEELIALGATREQLATWMPPDAQLGFRIAPETSKSNVLRPARWWRQPMPAWAQAAAAVGIFATGVMLGTVRGVMQPANGGLQEAALARPNTTVVANAANAAPITRADLVALEQRLRSEMSQARPASQSVAASPADSRILERVRVMIDESEQRQRRELALRSAELVRDFDAQRNVDLSRIERTLGQMDGTTGVEVAQQRQMLNYLMRVSQRGQ
jgi:predicted anti-sigma-YlaC factor YlaD